jgi:hypothetical protein
MFKLTFVPFPAMFGYPLFEQQSNKFPLELEDEYSIVVDAIAISLPLSSIIARLYENVEFTTFGTTLVELT